jgi:flagellar basal body-associated protein FliL
MPTDGNKEITGQSKSGRRSILMIGLVVLVMGLEGGGIFIAMKVFGGGPKEVDAAAIGGADDLVGWTESGFVEIHVADLEAPHVKTGRSYIYDIRVSVRIKPEAKPKVDKLLANHKEMLMDRLNRIIRSAEPTHLEEDGLEVIRRQMKYELDQALGDETVVEEVLLPRFMKMKADI